MSLISGHLVEPDFLRLPVTDAVLRNALSSLPLAARAPDRRPSTPQPKQFIALPALTAAGLFRLQKKWRAQRLRNPPIVE